MSRKTFKIERIELSKEKVGQTNHKTYLAQNTGCFKHFKKKYIWRNKNTNRSFWWKKCSNQTHHPLVPKPPRSIRAEPGQLSTASFRPAANRSPVTTQTSPPPQRPKPQSIFNITCSSSTSVLVLRRSCLIIDPCQTMNVLFFFFLSKPLLRSMKPLQYNNP